MSKNRYSEEEAVQKPAGELLAKLGWDVQYCFDEEKLGLYGTLGRESYHDVLLRRDLESALAELNEPASRRCRYQRAYASGARHRERSYRGE